MTTTTLSSRQRFGNLLGQLLRRNIASAIFIFVIMFIFFPLQMILETQRELAMVARSETQVVWQDILTQSRMYTSVSGISMIVILIIAAFVVGLVQCSYLHNKRAVDLYHSLPVTRTQLMGAGMITSFVTIAVPYLLNYAINLGVSIYRVVMLGERNYAVLVPQEIFWDCFGWLVAIFAMLAVINLVATQVGSVFENFVLAGEIFVAPLVIVGINQMLFGLFLAGYVTATSIESMCSLTPATFMIGRMTSDSDSTFFAWVTIIWLVLAVVITVVSMKLYNRRRSEIAETSGCRGVLGIIFVTVAVYIVAPVFGAIMFGTINGNLTFNGSLKLPYIIGVVVGAVISFVLVEAILSRGFAGLARKLPKGAAICAFVTAVAIIVTTGGLGYETRVPSASSIDSVGLDIRGWYSYIEVIDRKALNIRQKSATSYSTSYKTVSNVTFTDDESIEVVRKIHDKLIAVNKAEYDNNDHYWGTYFLEYKLGNGWLKRNYTRSNNEVRSLLSQLEDTDSFQRAVNPMLSIDPHAINKIVLHDNLGFATSELTTKSEIEALIKAIGNDSLARGSAPYIGGEPVLCYVFVDVPYVQVNSDYLRESVGNIYEPNGIHYNSFSIPVFASYKETIAQLGSNLPPKADVSEITEIGLSVYDNSKNWGNRDRFVSRVNNESNPNFKWVARFDYSSTDRSQIEYTVDNMINTTYITDSNRQIYATFMKGKETGITVVLDALTLPQGFLGSYPDLQEIYSDDLKNSILVGEVTTTVDAVG